MAVAYNSNLSYRVIFSVYAFKTFRLLILRVIGLTVLQIYIYVNYVTFSFPF